MHNCVWKFSKLQMITKESLLINIVSENQFCYKLVRNGNDKLDLYDH